jgi:carbonic anhydrase
LNAALAAFTVERELRSNDRSAIRAVYGSYLLETREVWAPHRGTTVWTGLADPPSDRAAFAELGNAVIQSNRITSLLKAG